MLTHATLTRAVDLRRRQRLLIEELFPRKAKGLVMPSAPFAVLVKKLQESLTRIESFDVSTVTPGLEGQSRYARFD